MKNLVITIVSFVAVIFGLLYFNACSQRTIAQNRAKLANSEIELKQEFRTLSDQWGDSQEVDTLISNKEWDLINSGDMTPEQMIACAQNVKQTYEADGSSYSNVLDDTRFKQAVEDYTEAKKELND